MRLTIKGEYPKDWKKVAARVKAEAGNRCIRCGHPDGDRLTFVTVPERDQAALAAGMTTKRKRVKVLVPCDDHCSHYPNRRWDNPDGSVSFSGKLRQLTVHHLDGDKSNCRWWNLLALCQLCHLTIQGKVIPERPFLWEHSDWFKPYAAGFYAFWYGKHDIAREVVMLDLDVFLEMGQPWLYRGDA